RRFRRNLGQRPPPPRPPALSWDEGGEAPRRRNRPRGSTAFGPAGNRMFDALSDRLASVFDRLSGRGVLSDKDIDEALREVREFIAKAKERASGEAVIRSVKPADQVVKITYDGLVEMLGGEGEPEGLNLSLNPPTIIMMAGLQGSGKTTTAGKLALRLGKERKKVLLASLDTRRPAAMEQLATLAQQAGVESLPIVAGQSAPDIAKRAMSAARLQGYDVVIL